MKTDKGRLESTRFLQALCSVVFDVMICLGTPGVMKIKDKEGWVG